MKLWLSALALLYVSGVAAASPPDAPAISPAGKGAGADPFEEKPRPPVLQVGVLTDEIIRKAIHDTPAEPAAPNAAPGHYSNNFGASKEEIVLTRAFQEAKVPDCLHEDAMKFTPPRIGPISLGGEFALPFWRTRSSPGIVIGCRMLLMRQVEVIFLMVLFFISGCATGEKRTEIVISASGCEVNGEIYHSRTLLANALISKKIRKVHFVSGPGVSYRQVESALGAARDAGITDIGLIGSGWGN